MEQESLKPCPCCGSASLETTENINESNNLGRCGAVWCECGLHMSARTLKEAMTAWNTRAAVTDEQFAMAVHDGRAWQVVRECEWSPEHDGENFVTECGAMFFWEPPAPLHCPHCGGHVKVVAE